MTASPDRARALMARPNAWLEARADGYVLRLGADRRARIVTTIDEAAFRALVSSPGLKPRPGGGWTARPVGEDSPDTAGRPGFLPG